MCVPFGHNEVVSTMAVATRVITTPRARGCTASAPTRVSFGHTHSACALLHGRGMGGCFTVSKAGAFLPVFRGGRENWALFSSILRDNRGYALQCSGLPKRRVGVDITMPFDQVLPIPVGATPFKSKAILAQVGFVRLALVPSNALWLCIAFTTCIARVGAIRSCSSTGCQRLSRRQM